MRRERSCSEQPSTFQFWIFRPSGTSNNTHGEYKNLRKSSVSADGWRTSPAGNVKHLNLVCCGQASAKTYSKYSTRGEIITSVMNISSFLTSDSWRQIPVSINGAAAWLTLWFLLTLYLRLFHSSKTCTFHWCSFYRAHWVRKSDSDAQRADEVRPCGNLGGNSWEARTNAAASSPYWQHFGLVSLIYYRFRSIFKFIFHRSINAGLPSLAIHWPEWPHHITSILHVTRFICVRKIRHVRQSRVINIEQ